MRPSPPSTRGDPSLGGARGCSRPPQLIPGGHPRWRTAPLPPLRMLGDAIWALALSLERRVPSLHGHPAILPAPTRVPHEVPPRMTPDREECDCPRFRPPFRGAEGSRSHHGSKGPASGARWRAWAPGGGLSGETKPSTRPLNRFRNGLFLLTNATLSLRQMWISNRKQPRSPVGSAPVTEDVSVPCLGTRVYTHTHTHARLCTCAHVHPHTHTCTPCTHHSHAHSGITLRNVWEPALSSRHNVVDLLPRGWHFRSWCH